jgi:crotonobetainyl-CoA:carnitine CoA-transferase CaiB-like acyl-CoA transferase
MTLPELHVIEVGDVRTSMAGRLFADLGTSVTRIEPEEPRSTQFGPFTKSGESIYHAFYNRSKRVLRTSNPLAAIDRCIIEAGAKRLVIIIAPEDFPEGNAPCGEELRRLYPAAIVVELLDFGVYRGPRRYSNLSVAARGGQMAVCGREDRPPLMAPGHQPVNLAGLYAAIAALSAAIHDPDQGTLACISLQACVASSIENALVAYFSAGKVQRRQGVFHWSRNSFVGQTADGNVLVMLLHDWDTLISWLAVDGMQSDLADPKYGNPMIRRQNDYVFHIAETMAPWLATKQTRPLLEDAHARRFPWSEVAQMSDTARSEHLKERGFTIPGEPSGAMPIGLLGPLLWGRGQDTGGTRQGMLARQAAAGKEAAQR